MPWKPGSPSSAGAVRHAGRGSSRQQRQGLGTGMSSTPQSKSCPPCVPQMSPFTKAIYSQRIQDRAPCQSPVRQGSTATCSVCIVATVTSRGRNTTEVVLFLNRNFLLSHHRPAFPPQLSAPVPSTPCRVAATCCQMSWQQLQQAGLRGDHRQWQHHRCPELHRHHMPRSYCY